MTISSLLKELKLLCRDLHGLAVLFVMPIAFMLIMSLALSRDQDPHTDSRIALVGIANDSINTALAAALEKEQIHVTRMPSETNACNTGLHSSREPSSTINTSKPKPCMVCATRAMAAGWL